MTRQYLRQYWAALGNVLVFIFDGNNDIVEKWTKYINNKSDLERAVMQMLSAILLLMMVIVAGVFAVGALIVGTIICLVLIGIRTVFRAVRRVVEFVEYKIWPILPDAIMVIALFGFLAILAHELIGTRVLDWFGQPDDSNSLFQQVSRFVFTWGISIGVSSVLASVVLVSALKSNTWTPGTALYYAEQKRQDRLEAKALAQVPAMFSGAPTPQPVAPNSQKYQDFLNNAK